MSEQMNLNEKTVIELRKIAKELHVPLGAGISKQGIIDKLTDALAAQQPAAPTAEPEAPVEKPAEEAAAQPAFRQAYTAPRFNNRPAYQAPAYNSRAGAPRPSTAEPQRTQTTRPVGFTHRFGPAAPEAPQQTEEERPVRAEQPRPAYSADRRTPYQDSPRYPQRPAYEPPQRPAFEQPQRPPFEQRPAFEQPQHPAYEQRPAAPYAAPRRENAYPQDAAPVAAPSEFLNPSECPDASGTLELHPDGYGFLRGENLLASGKDVYVAAAQVRRFGLRTGDVITGKMRPQREGDKYPALLYVTEVNGIAADHQPMRPNFEHLTPIYPTRRISLDAPDGSASDLLRLLDLLTPIGFGQRALLQCPPNVDKRAILRQLANVIAANHPQSSVLTVLFNETPEDVTVYREQVTCPVLATTFDMTPESHLRLSEMVMERAMRMVENRQDVVLLVDSLTTLAKVVSTAAVQQGRQTPGTLSPSSLYKAKRLFGAARCAREGGSLTVIAVMNTATGSKLDDAIVSEFRGTANMELVLDATLATNDVNPPIDLLHSGTRRAEAIMSPAHAEGLKLIRSMLSGLNPVSAIPEMVSMLKKSANNEELLARLKDWAVLMKG